MNRFSLPVLALFGTTLAAQEWTPRNGMPQRVQAAITFDAARGHLLLFGGNPVSANVALGGFPTMNFGDTWRLEPTGWREVRTAHTPGARAMASMVFDVARQRVVLFGGIATNSTPFPGDAVSDTWEFDGTDWSQRTTAHAPPPRMFQQLVHDPARQRTVLHGGVMNGIQVVDTWEFDGTDWTPITTPTTPPLAFVGVLGYLGAAGRVVLAGTTTNSWPGTYQTWTYDGTTWTLAPTAHTPPSSTDWNLCATSQGHLVSAVRSNVSPSTPLQTWRFDGIDWTQQNTAHTPPDDLFGPMVFDPPRQRLVMVGRNASWAFDGTDWTLAVPSRTRERNLAAAMAVDWQRGRLVTFGGYKADASGVRFHDEHWEWDGQDWFLVPQTIAPSPRDEGLMVYDPARQRLVLHGGHSATTTLSDTWEYDGQHWTSIATAHVPTQISQAMVHDPVRHRCVAYGMFFGVSLMGSTWTYDGVDWTQLNSPLQPPARYTPCMAFDAARSVVVLYGGTISSNQYADTWELHGDSWTRSNPQTRPQGTPAPATFDPVRGTTVLGTTSWTNPIFDTHYEYDGVRWRILPSLTTPPIPWPYPVIHDPRSQRLLTVSQWGDIWSYEPAPIATWAKLGTGCAIGNSPRLDTIGNATPVLGSTFPVQVTGLPAQPGVLLLAFGFGYATYLGHALPIDLGALGLPGCQLWIEPAGLGALVAHQGTTATYGVALPNQPALAGTLFAVQGLTLDPSSPNGLGPTTNAGIATVF